MTLAEAERITQVWGVYLEYIQGKLGFVFMAYIPESFLPYPKTVLEEAINKVAEHRHYAGNQEAVQALHSGIGILTSYTDDETAIIQSAKSFADQNWREAVLPRFKEFQKRWIEMKENSPER